MGKIILEVRDLKTKYITRFHEDVYAVDGVSFRIEEGKSLGVAGESGCGKSTLALSMMGYYFPPLHYISGDIIIDGQNISGLDPDTVYQYRGKWGPEAETSGFYSLALNTDLSDPENYRKVAEHVDIDSVIGWAVIQAYCGNTDLHSDNMRFYYTAEDDVLHYALVDVDHGMENEQAFDCTVTLGYKYNKLFAALLHSGEFRARLISQMEEAFSGPLNEENVVARIDEMAALIRPEMPRDRERWGAKMTWWEHLVENNKNYFLNFGGRTSIVRDGLKYYIGATPEWRDFYYKPKEN